MSYSLREVSAMLGLSQTRIRAYAAQGFLEPDRSDRRALRFGFHDLILLRTASELSAAKIPSRKVRRVLERLRDQLPEGRALTGVRITAEGDRVIVRDGRSVWNPESGQALFDFPVSEIAEKSAPYLLQTAREARSRASETSAAEWYGLGCELELSAIDEAMDAYRRALAEDPAHSDAHVNLGRLLHEQGAAAAAEKHYRAALEADPQHGVAAFNLGVALEDLGRIRDAIHAYLLALQIQPDNADAHFNLAGIHERLGDKASALRHLKAYRALIA